MADNHFKISKGLSFDPQTTTPSNPQAGDIYYDSSLSKLRRYQNGSWGDFSSGSGTKNFISNGDAEADASGWALYTDAGIRPVDGTGGVGTGITFTRSTTAPLESLGSFILTKDTSNRQGSGVSYDFTIDSAYKAKVLSIEMDYLVNSGTFVAGSSGVDSDIIAYIYDVTNATLIEPSSFKLLSNSTTISDKFRSTFQTSATGTQYRLILHCTSGLSNAFSLKLDNIKVTPSTYVYGTPVTDWASFTPTITTSSGSVTNATISARWRRVGSSSEVAGRITFSAASAVFNNIIVSTPPGQSIDNINLINCVGEAGCNDSGNAIYPAQVSTLTTTTLIIYPYNASGTYASVSALTNVIPFTFGAADSIDFKYSIPIQGWSSSVQTSDQTDTRVVGANYVSASATLTTSYSLITFLTKVSDSHGSYNSGSYTVPVSGLYDVSAMTVFSATYSLNQNANLAIFIDGIEKYTGVVQLQAAVASIYPAVNVKAVPLNAGQIVTIRGLSQGGSPTLSSNAATSSFSIARVSGPQAIAASESVNLRYTNTAGTSIPATTGTNSTSFSTLSYDSHGAWNGTTFTAPISGKYRFSVAEFYASATWSASAKSIKLIKNGTVDSYLSVLVVGTGYTGFLGLNGTGDVSLIAGDTVTIGNQHNEGTARTFDTIAGINYICIARIGN